jgi:hypothetical protein
MSSIEELIKSAAHDMYNPALNFEIAKKYDELSQTASAVSFYLRTAEYGYESHPLLAYSALLKMSVCFDDQKDRTHTVSNCILQAISHIPTRPEGYFFLSRFYERAGQWQESYTFAQVGLTFSKLELEPLPMNTDYHGEYVLLFEKAVSAWWIGRKDESAEIFKQLDVMDISPDYKASVQNNLARINVTV